jgi:hypothetical protein
MKNHQFNTSPAIDNKAFDMARLTEGNLLIPDISGFTKFVQDTDMDTGSYVISRLLTRLLDCNILNLKVSEIEGDAILFYKMGKRLSPENVLSQFEFMQKGFSAELQQLSAETGITINLGLKLIAHYGPVSEYHVGGFTKLYGTSVIEAHRLLKNSINSNEYVIMTDNLLVDECLPNGRPSFGNKLCETYSQLESICFTWLSFIPEISNEAQLCL